jgi:GxxExxY protein
MAVNIETQKELSVPYKDTVLNAKFRLDMIVEDTVIVEFKTVEKILPIHEAQLLTYLKLADKRVGLLFNFNEVLLKDGLRRIAN